MDLKEILFISGKGGLFKLVSKSKNSVIVESFIDKKRFPVFASDKVSSLNDISIYAVDRDVPLLDILKTIKEKEKGGKAIDHKSDNKLIKNYMEEILPDYDSERVYVSDMKKLFYWYNLLVEYNLLDFTESEVNNNQTEEQIIETEEQIIDSEIKSI